MPNDDPAARESGDAVPTFEVDTVFEVSSSTECRLIVHKDITRMDLLLTRGNDALVPVEAGSRLILKWGEGDERDGFVVFRRLDGPSELPRTGS